MTIEEQLKQEIIKQYGTVKALSDKINKPPTTVNTLLKQSIKKSGSEIVCLICNALNIDFYELMKGNISERGYSDIKLTHKELSLIEDYRALDDYGTNAVDTILTIEKDRNVYYDNKIRYIYKPLIWQSAAAGTGDIIDPYAESETVKIARTPESEASDFIIILTGDSMEPTYSDHDYLLIHSQPSVCVGDIGLFVYQNDAFVKELGNDGLISHNKDYDLIKIHHPEQFQTIGKVLGKTEIVKE